MFLLGIVIELVAYRPLKGSHDVHVVVIATLGVAIIIRTIMALWQGSSPRSLRSWFNPGEISRLRASSATASCGSASASSG